MKFKGTIGKWQVKHSESKNAFNVIGTIPGGNYKIARCPYYVDERLPEYSARNRVEAEANAILIAKAPELLEALITAKNILESPKLIDAGDLRRLINSAINKALTNNPQPTTDNS